MDGGHAVREVVPGTARELGVVEFEVLDVVKGSFGEDKARFPGQMDSYSGPNKQTPPYTRTRGSHGSCFATDYAAGREYLLFLRRPHHYWHSIPRGGGELTPYWTTLGPTAEEVTGRDDPWLSWVEDRVAQLAGK